MRQQTHGRRTGILEHFSERISESPATLRGGSTAPRAIFQSTLSAANRLCSAARPRNRARSARSTFCVSERISENYYIPTLINKRALERQRRGSITAQPIGLGTLGVAQGCDGVAPLALRKGRDSKWVIQQKSHPLLLPPERDLGAIIPPLRAIRPLLGLLSIYGGGGRKFSTNSQKPPSTRSKRCSRKYIPVAGASPSWKS